MSLVLFFCGLGELLEPSLQGLAASLTDAAQNAQLFTTIAMCDGLAEIVAGPLHALLLDMGRQPGHNVNGYIFLASSVRQHSSI
jgi:hypothetical protein